MPELNYIEYTGPAIRVGLYSPDGAPFTDHDAEMALSELTPYAWARVWDIRHHGSGECELSLERY